MPSTKTEGTELSMAFGILGIKDPLNLSLIQLSNYFNNMLPMEKYLRFKNDFFQKYNQLYYQIYYVGKKLRKNYPLFKQINNLYWAGPQRQAITTSASKDLLVANTPVSVKTESNVVLNPSPFNFFNSIPKGIISAQDSGNWFFELCPNDYQNLYTYVRASGLNHLPDSIDEFEQIATKEDRKVVQKTIKQFSVDEKKTFTDLYINLCHRISEISAKTFNENVTRSLKSKVRCAIIENIAKSFFRLNTIEYILGGVDRNEEFALVIPDITAWRQNWTIKNIEALPDLMRKQSVVNLRLTYGNKMKEDTHKLNFHVEIRWSHGKFCGAPEAKLYKDFQWKDVVFFRSIL